MRSVEEKKKRRTGKVHLSITWSSFEKELVDNRMQNGLGIEK
jgi:hypothetical protein